MSATVKSRRTAAHPTMSWKEESDEGVESEMDLQNEDEDPEQSVFPILWASFIIWQTWRMDFQNALKKMLCEESSPSYSQSNTSSKYRPRD